MATAQQRLLSIKPQRPQPKPVEELPVQDSKYAALPSVWFGEDAELLERMLSFTRENARIRSWTLP